MSTELELACKIATTTFGAIVLINNHGAWLAPNGENEVPAWSAEDAPDAGPMLVFEHGNEAFALVPQYEDNGRLSLVLRGYRNGEMQPITTGLNGLVTVAIVTKAGEPC